MKIVLPAFAEDMPSWPHANLDGSLELFDEMYEEPARATVLGAARNHDLELAKAGGAAFGMLWVPDPTTGTVGGTGATTMFEFDASTTIDAVLAQFNTYQRSFREKVHVFEFYREDDHAFGPAGIQRLVRTRRGHQDIECFTYVWIMLDELTAVRFSVAWLDPVHEPAIHTALANVVASADLVEST